MKHAERAHARFSPSQAYRIKACPGSVNLCLKAPPEPSSSYALEGTAAHEHLERLLKQSPDYDWQSVPEEMRPHLKTFTDYVDEIVNIYQCDMTVEQRLDIPGIPDAGGTVDCLLIASTASIIEVIDLKYGEGVLVEVEDNPQLMQYALAAVMKVSPPIDWKVNITIIQPRAAHREGPIRSTVMTAGDIYEYALEVAEMVDQASKPEAPRNPGSWCNWCQARTICPEIQELAAKTMRSDFSGIVEITKGVLQEDIPVDRIGDILTAGVIIKRWLSSVEKLALDRLRAGEKIDGWKMVGPKPMRRWRADLKQKEIIQNILETLDMSLKDKDILAPRKIIGVTAVDKLAAKYAKDFVCPLENDPKVIKAETMIIKKRLLEQIAENIEKSASGGPKLAPESDPRPSLVVGDDFAQTKVEG